MPFQPPTTVAGRYHLGRRLGRGGHGEVWEARDALTGRSVAVKLLVMGARNLTAVTRREIAALRSVQVPGVVRLLDEGVQDGRQFLVLDLVTGTPFPGMAIPAPWEALREPSLALLEILGRVHAVGVVHRDLKPGNVLVTSEGRPVVLDFGVSWGTLDAVATPLGEVVGTPAYVSPEQVQGERATAASDLFTLGVMLFEALSGRLPYTGVLPLAAMLSRCHVDAPPLRSVCPDAPEAVAATVDALLKRAPGDRPGSAREVLERLAGRASMRAGALDLEGPALDRAALESLIHGPSRIFHVPEDAAALLWERTGGDRRRVRAELDGWVRTGLARRDGEGVAMDRAALDVLLEEQALPSFPAATASLRASAHRVAAEALAPGTEGRLRHLVRALAGADHGAEALLVEAAATARSRMAQGRSGAALAALSEGWMAAVRLREECPEAPVRALFATWAECALLDGVPASVDRVLYELARAPSGYALSDLEGLLRASLASRTGGEQGLALASALRFEELGLELCRHAVRLQAARRCPREVEERALGELEAWAATRPDDAAVGAFVAGWRGRYSYRLHAFEDAARWQELAAEREPAMLRRFGWLAGAASAWLNACEPAAAQALASRLLRLASKARHLYAEAWAEYLERASSYQSCAALVVDEALLSAFALVPVDDLRALLVINEAMVAFRRGEHARARDLASSAADHWHTSDWQGGYAPCRALALHLGAPSEPGEVEGLAERALGLENQRLAVQVLALLAGGVHTVPTTWRAAAERCAATIPRDRWQRRMKLLSVDEVLERLSGGR